MTLAEATTLYRLAPYSGTLLFIVGGVLGVLIFLRWRITSKHRSHLPLPPGPNGLPLVGSVVDFADKHPWNKCREWAREYGEVVHVNLFGHSVVILNTHQAAVDLLETRSANYSDRPSLPVVPLLGIDWHVPFMPYGPRWRKHRRVIHQLSNDGAVRAQLPVQQQKARELLRRLRDAPQEYADNTLLSIGSALMELVYGNLPEEKMAEYLRLAEDATQALTEAFLPGTLAVQYLPFLRHLPSWFPGGRFQERLLQLRGRVNAFLNGPFYDVKEAMIDGSADSCFVTKALVDIENLQDTEKRDEEDAIKYCAAVVYSGGSDTSHSTILTFLLAMVLHPEAQRCAQEELMAVVGSHRLPDFSDRDALPYVNALVRECTRWIPVAPIGFPHGCTEEDEYRGYRIPKGATVIPNQWLMMHDPAEYPDPDCFKPQRFLKDGKLNPDVKNPNEIAFGFGRRICPGRSMAENTLFITIASILHVFEISPMVNSAGIPIIPKTDDLTSALNCRPNPFPYSISVRSKEASALIDSVQYT